MIRQIRSVITKAGNMRLRHLKLGSQFLETLVLVAALSVLATYVGGNLYSRYTRIQELQRERANSATKFIAANLEAELVAIDNVLRSVRQDLTEQGWKGAGGKEFNRRLKNFDDAMPSIRSIFVLDAEGTVIASDRPEIIGKNFREREYFQVPQRSADPSVLYMSQPYMTTRGDLNVAFSRMVADDRGAFAGVVAAALDPSYFKTLLDSVRYAPDVWASLVHGEGKLFLTIPVRSELAGQNLKVPGSMFSRHVESGQTNTVFSGIIFSTGEDRIIAQRTFQPSTLSLNKPFVIAVATDLKAHVSGLRSDIVVQMGLFFLLAFGSIFGLRLHHRRERRSVEIEESDKLRWKTILRTASDGIHVLDTEGLLIEANEAFLTMLGYDQSAVGVLRVTDWDAKADWATIKARNDRLIDQRGKEVFETNHRRSDGSIIDVEINASGIEIDGRGYLYAASRDITERKRKEVQLEVAAHHDGLTGLPNRLLFADRLQQAISQIERTQKLLIVGYLDLDGFKPVNDTYGHQSGDRVLVEVANRLRLCLRGGDTVARLGGDEFVFLLVGLDRFAECEIALQRMLAAIAQPIEIGDVSINLSASIGVTIYPADAVDTDSLLKHADHAMYRAKAAGKNRYQVFNVDGVLSPAVFPFAGPGA